MQTKDQVAKKPGVVDKYQGVKRESVSVILTDKNGKQTKIKL